MGFQLYGRYWRRRRWQQWWRQTLTKSIRKTVASRLFWYRRVIISKSPKTARTIRSIRIIIIVVDGELHHRFQFPVSALNSISFSYIHTIAPALNCSMKQHWMYGIKRILYMRAILDQLNTHLKIQTYFPHEILSMCWNIKMNFINIFTQNSDPNSCFIHSSERFCMISCVFVASIYQILIRLGKFQCPRIRFFETISTERCLSARITDIEFDIFVEQKSVSHSENF